MGFASVTWERGLSVVTFLVMVMSGRGGRGWLNDHVPAANTALSSRQGRPPDFIIPELSPIPSVVYFDKAARA